MEKIISGVKISKIKYSAHPFLILKAILSSSNNVDPIIA